MGSRLRSRPSRPASRSIPATAWIPAICGSAVYPNVSGNPNLPKSERTEGRWFDTSAFSQPAQWTIGNAGRGLIWGPGQRNIDMTLSKYFSITERVRMQFRAEAYNLTNTKYFANPNVAERRGNVRPHHRRLEQLAARCRWR